MNIENLDVCPHDHISREAEIVELFATANSQDVESTDARNEALISAGVAVVALGGTAMIADLLNNEEFTQISFAAVGTGILLGLSYFTAPYLAETRLGLRIESWAEPRRLRTEEKKLQGIKNSTAKREERDLKRTIKINTRNQTGRRTRLFY